MSASTALPVDQPAAEKPSKEPTQPTSIPTPRLWPAIVLVAAYWAAWVFATYLNDNQFVQFMTMFFGPMVLAAGMLAWWLGLSKLTWVSRLWGVGCLGLCFGVAYLLAHKSVNWMGLLMYALPVALTASVVWMVLTRGAQTVGGWAGLAAISAVTFGYQDLLRIDGITGALVAEKSWRWTDTPEDRFLREQQRLAAAKPSAAAAASPLVASPGDWTEFRGSARDGHVKSVSFRSDWKDADWTKQPPREVWRRLVGPGWSSFTVIGDRVFTQEQRGKNEAVTCVDLATGNEVWSHEDEARFEEIVAGAGPRATPTFHAGKIYALGGSGKLNCLDAATGKPLWSRDIVKDSGLKAAPTWGFSSSPLVAQGIVTVFAGDEVGKVDEAKLEKGELPAKAADAPAKPAGAARGLLGYDAETGDLKWSAGKGKHSYSSPQLATLSGVEQVLMESDRGVEAFEPATGKLLWEHEWFLEGMFRVCQPLVVEGQRVLVGTGMGNGTRLVSVVKNGEAWTATENWTSKELKPYFNDFVERDGYLYGFDGNIFVCLNLETGKRQWKKGRYGNGQVLLVGDDGLMIIISETGDAVLALGTPQDLTVRGRIKALQGKTWNHPVVTADGKLLVRNGEEMACYDLVSGPALPAAHSPQAER